MFQLYLCRQNGLLSSLFSSFANDTGIKSIKPSTITRMPQFPDGKNYIYIFLYYKVLTNIVA